MGRGRRQGRSLSKPAGSARTCKKIQHALHPCGVRRILRLRPCRRPHGRLVAGSWRLADWLAGRLAGPGWEELAGLAGLAGCPAGCLAGAQHPVQQEVEGNYLLPGSFLHLTVTDCCKTCRNVTGRHAEFPRSRLPPQGGPADDGKRSDSVWSWTFHLGRRRILITFPA